METLNLYMYLFNETQALYYHKKYSRSRLIQCALFTKCVLLNAQIYILGCQEVWHIDNGITFPRQSFVYW